MITIEELEKLLLDIENSRVERTIYHQYRVHEE